MTNNGGQDLAPVKEVEVEVVSANGARIVVRKYRGYVRNVLEAPLFLADFRDYCVEQVGPAKLRVTKSVSWGADLN